MHVAHQAILAQQHALVNHTQHVHIHTTPYYEQL